MPERRPGLRHLRQMGAIVALVVAASAAAGSPQQDYITHCMGCHGPDGVGVTGKVPPLRESLPAFARTSEGRAFLLSVPGASNSSLSDAQLAAVVNWLLVRFAGPDVAADRHVFTENEVASLRRPPLSKVKEARKAVLRTLAGTGPVPAEEY